MNNLSQIFIIISILVINGICVLSVFGQDQSDMISAKYIEALNTKRIEAGKTSSAARKKLAIRRVIREGESLINQHPTAPNRYEILYIIFRSQQVLVGLDKSEMNRKAFLATCEKLAAAPNEYASLRFDADLLLTQAKSARLGANSHARSDALRPLVARYQDTDVEVKVIRISMIMALEFGNTKLVNDLREVIAERFPGNMDLINFQRDKLAGQVFGAPFIGTFQQSNGKTVRFPMDYLGTTTAVYFWSKEDGGMEDLKELAEAWKKTKPEDAARMQFVSFNLDDLPDAGKSILRDHGLDWPALKLVGGKDNPTFHTYARFAPRIITVSPTGYAAIFMSGGRRSRGYERNLQSMLAREWTQPRYTSQLQSMFIGDALVVDPTTTFDPAQPVELKVLATKKPLKRTNDSVPEDKLRAIQSCFINPPMRYRTPLEQVRSGYDKAQSLCQQVIADHPDADDLWIVRNRRIIALMGLWKIDRDPAQLEAAIIEAKTALTKGYPPGTDVVPRFCLARKALQEEGADTNMVIKQMLQQIGLNEPPGSALLAASLLSLDTGERRFHDQYRRSFLDRHANNPATWTATTFFLNRYHRYWLYHPPFTAGWTYGRRQNYFLPIGIPEDAHRNLKLELQTLDGKTVRLPEDAQSKWTVIEFRNSAEVTPHLNRYGTFIKERPFEDVNVITAILSNDVASTREAYHKRIEEQKKRRQGPDLSQTLLVPGGLNNPVVQQLGILDEDTKPNIAIIRPDGKIAAVLSGLSTSKGNAVQNVLEWQDEKAVDDALARNDIDEAKRLAFAYAPVEQAIAPGSKQPKPKKLSIPHLRSRAKVYFAMGDLEAAYADAEEVFLAVNITAGYISMRTDELEKTESLKATILTAIKNAASK